MGEMADLWDKFFSSKVSSNPSENLKWIENEQLKLLLKEAHDLMDDFNSDSRWSDEKPYCGWCKTWGYDQHGLIHKDDCILVRIRKAINV